MILTFNHTLGSPKHQTYKFRLLMFGTSTWTNWPQSDGVQGGPLWTATVSW